METPEQQRRPTIGQSAQKLRQCGLDFDAVDLADMFWLAQFIELDKVTYSPEVAEPSSKPSSVRVIDDETAPSSESIANLYVDNRFDTQSQPSATAEAEKEEEKPQGLPFPVPAAPALRTRLDLARSLRPLMCKVPSRIRQELDEEATVTQIAETRLWIPVVRPQPERWLDLDLVVEDSKTTVIWERAIAEFQHLMEYQGAFRTIRTWRLSVPDLQTAKAADVKLFPRWREPSENRSSQRPRSPRELIDPGSRRLILLLTDCTSLLWWRGLIHETLWAWAEIQPVSIVQLFPERLWTRTALSNGHIVRLGTTAPGLPSARLEIEGLPELDVWDEYDDADESLNNGLALADEQRQLAIPIVTFDPISMHRWARVVAGGGDVLTPGRVFELKVVRQMAQEYQAPSASTSRPRTARQRVALFRTAASEIAQQLAEYMAATPVSLPVIDLLRDEFVPQARQEHVAEVLLSGLLKRCDDEGDGKCRYKFFGDGEPVEKTERVRYLLLDSVPVSRTREVLDRLSQLIKDKAGNTLKSFDAFLAAFEASGSALGEGALPLAEIGLDVLQRLGGPHAALAQRYVSVLQGPEKRQQPQSTTGDDFSFQDLEYEVAEFLNFPPLKSFSYRSPTITAILTHAFESVTATIEQERRLLGLRREWVIRRRQIMTWGYIEALRSTSETEEPLGLDMVAVPGGTFIMGAPKKESGSNDDEQPQHEVTLQPFYMSRYPITQAQWRAIATSRILNFDEALKATDSAVRAGRGKGLRDIERIVLEGAWNQQTYQEIAAEAGYTESDLSRDGGPALWSLLSDVLGMQVKKTNFRTAIERWSDQRILDPDPANFKGDNRPVEQVSWEDATEFCRRLAAKTGKDYRLPTEAEWEYACRAGTPTPFHFGETITPELANYAGNYVYGDGLKGEYRKQTTEVGSFPANAFGLYDMHGNVWEWCQDTWHDNYEGAPTDGSAWISSDERESRRVLRGGSWDDSPVFCRSASRGRLAPGSSTDGVGFRVVCAIAR